MRTINSIELVCLESVPPKISAKVYDLGARQQESDRLRRIKVLERENALLMAKVSEIHIELERLRKLLTAP
jgi:hypothetical protein